MKVLPGNLCLLTFFVPKITKNKTTMKSAKIVNIFMKYFVNLFASKPQFVIKLLAEVTHW